jgi:hypothetical protein
VAKRIAEKAIQSASANADQTDQHEDLIDAILVNDIGALERLATELGDGVTADDIRWY